MGFWRGVNEDTKYGYSIVFPIFLVSIGAIVLLYFVALPAKVFNPDNVITKYEWFHDAKAQVEARYSQIRSYKTVLETANLPNERARIVVELEAMRTACRELSNRYNQNSQKLNQAIFKDRGLPVVLPMEKCENGV